MVSKLAIGLLCYI